MCREINALKKKLESLEQCERFETLEPTKITLLQNISLLKEQDSSMQQKIKYLEEKLVKNEQKTGFVEDQLNIFLTKVVCTLSFYFVNI